MIELTMLHVMLDMYGSDSYRLNDLRSIYEVLYKVVNSTSVKAISPPILVPYYYGSVKEDDGISAFVLLDGGHLTIHTFPERECYFVDMLYDGFVSDDKILEIFNRELPFEDKIVNIVDRRFDVAEQCELSVIDEKMDFGPHYLIRIDKGKLFTMDEIYHFLDELPLQINMDAIMRPIVVTDKVKNYKKISGITVIAQSHIALHHNIEKKQSYIDIFSCSFINCDNVLRVVEETLGVQCESMLISRGSKHHAKLALRDEVIERYNRWRKNTSTER